MAVIGHPRLSRQLNQAVKEHFQSNRPFITVVIDLEGEVQVATNMDLGSERVRLLELAVERIKTVM